MFTSRTVVLVRKLNMGALCGFAAGMLPATASVANNGLLKGVGRHYTTHVVLRYWIVDSGPFFQAHPSITPASHQYLCKYLF